MNDHLTGKIKEEKRIKELKKQAAKDVQISELALAMLDK